MGISTNWTHPQWNPTGSVNVSEPPVYANALPIGNRPIFQQPQAGQMFSRNTGNWGGGGGWVGGGGGGGGGYRFDPNARDVRIGNPGGTMARPSPVAAGGQTMGSVSNFYKLQAKPSAWDQLQAQAVYDINAAKDAVSARKAWQADNVNPAAGGPHSWDTGSAVMPDTGNESWNQPPKYETGGIVPPNQWAEVGDQAGNPLAASEYVRSAAPIEVVPNQTGKVMAPEFGNTRVNQWAAPMRAVAPVGVGADTMQPWRDSTSPEARQVFRDRFMRTPQGHQFLDIGEANQKAAAEAAQAKGAFEQWKMAQQQAHAKTIEDLRHQHALEKQQAAGDMKGAATAEATSRKNNLMAVELSGQQQRMIEMANSGVLDPKQAEIYGNIIDPKVLGKVLDHHAKVYQDNHPTKPIVGNTPAGAEYVQGKGVQITSRPATTPGAGGGQKWTPATLSAEITRAEKNIAKYQESIKDSEGKLTIDNPDYNQEKKAAAWKEYHWLQDKKAELMGTNQVTIPSTGKTYRFGTPQQAAEFRAKIGE